MAGVCIRVYELWRAQRCKWGWCGEGVGSVSQLREAWHAAWVWVLCVWVPGADLEVGRVGALW